MREHLIYKIAVNVKGNIRFVYHLKGVQYFPICQKVNNYYNLESLWTLSHKGV